MASSKMTSEKKQSKPAHFPPFFIRLSGVGDFIDVRFKVNAEAMRPGPVYIKDEKTGKTATVATVPKIGWLMTRRTKVGNTAFLILKNPDNSIKAGSLVTLVVGQYRKEHIPVLG